MRFNLDTDEEEEISMGPLIDCVFLLLIFFLVATMLKKDDYDIDINPPISESAVKLPPRDDVLVIGIDVEGHFYWQGNATTLNQLHDRLRDVADKQPDRSIRLDVDQDTPFHRVVEVMNVCQFRGLKDVGIRTYDKHYNSR